MWFTRWPRINIFNKIGTLLERHIYRLRELNRFFQQAECPHLFIGHVFRSEAFRAPRYQLVLCVVEIHRNPPHFPNIASMAQIITNTIPPATGMTQIRVRKGS
jgi:hypothetical protein